MPGVGGGTTPSVSEGASVLACRLELWRCVRRGVLRLKPRFGPEQYGPAEWCRHAPVALELEVCRRLVMAAVEAGGQTLSMCRPQGGPGESFFPPGPSLAPAISPVAEVTRAPWA